MVCRELFERGGCRVGAIEREVGADGIERDFAALDAVGQQQPGERLRDRTELEHGRGVGVHECRAHLIAIDEGDRRSVVLVSERVAHRAEEFLVAGLIGVGRGGRTRAVPRRPRPMRCTP